MSGWPTANLGDVCIVRRGSVITKKKANPGDVPVVAGGISPAYYHDMPNRDGPVITVSGSGANAGFVNFFDRPIWASDCSTIQPNGDALNVRYVYLFLLSMQQYINENLRQGAAQPHVYPKDLAKLKIPLPPKEEQGRIVSVLDQAFAALDRACSNAETNLADAEIIYRSQLASTFDAETTETQRLADVCDVRDGTHDTPKYVEDGVPLVTQKNVRWDGMHFEKCKNISYSDHQEISKRSRVDKGDILMSMIGVNRGECCLVESESEFSIKNVGLIRQTPAFDMQYLLQYLQSPMAARYIDHSTNGGAQPFVGLGKLRDFPVPKVSIAEQKKVIADLLTIRSRMRSLSAKCLEKLQDLEDLRQSILQKAFAGELT